MGIMGIVYSYILYKKNKNKFYKFFYIMFWPINYSHLSPRFKPRFSYAQVAMIDISESLVILKVSPHKKSFPKLFPKSFLFILQSL